MTLMVRSNTELEWVVLKAGDSQKTLQLGGDAGAVVGQMSGGEMM